MDLNLNDKCVLVTGSSKGIGFSIAYHFLIEGAKVFITSRSNRNLNAANNKIKNMGLDKKAEFLKTDFTKKKSILAIAKKIKKLRNNLDILVINVGDGRGSNKEVLNEKEWNNSWNINFNSALETVRALMPLIIESRGIILFISSIAGLETIGAPIAYSTAKASLTSYAKNLSKISSEIRVNTIAPGNILFKGGSWDKKMKKSEKEIMKKIEEIVPLKRFGTPDEIAHAAVFLCSDKANFINGATLIIDGGQFNGI